MDVRLNVKRAFVHFSLDAHCTGKFASDLVPVAGDPALSEADGISSVHDLAQSCDERRNT